MPITQREYVEFELDVLRRRFADVTNPGRQVTPSASGQEYRRRLAADIRELETRLASEEDATIPGPSTTTEARAAEEAPEAMSSDQEKELSVSQQEPSSS
jgi:hypothetical protein